MASLRVIQGCPVYDDIAPYIAICVNDAHATVDSIFRGDVARAILNKHGKHSQAQLYWISQHGSPAERIAVGLPPEGGGANPPGVSTHELRSDGVAYPGILRGHNLSWWMQGFDVNDLDVRHVIAAAASHGWHVFQPYRSGTEFHHLNFRAQPKRPTPGTRLWVRLWRIRATLPKS